jgi:hypothetical protein
MKKLLFSTLLFSLHVAETANAQDDTATHRKVYAEIEAAEGKMKQVKATTEVDGLEFELKGWREGKELRKIVARVPGEDGDGSEAYYFKGGELLFVFRQYAAAAEDGKKGAQVEDRFYLKDGALIKWLGSDKKAVSPGSEDFKLEGQRLEELSAAFVAALDEKPVAAAAVEMTGVFLGIEEGDYAHWRMKDGKGGEVSFFILKPEASVEAVLENPEKFVGKRCRVTWKKSMESVPVAGAASAEAVREMEVEQIFEVKWLGE